MPIIPRTQFPNAFYLFFHLRKYQDIIKEGASKVSILTEDSTHYSIECSWGICQPKRHNQILIQTKGSADCSFRHILWFDLNLVISTLKINPAKDSCSIQLIEHIINPGYRESILDFHSCTTICSGFPPTRRDSFTAVCDFSPVSHVNLEFHKRNR